MSKKRTPYNRKARHPTGQTLTQERPTGIIIRPVLNTGYSNGGASAEKQAMRGYWPIRSSPKSDVDVNLNILRNRSADMAINSPVGAAAINRYRTHVVGAGLVPSPCPDYRLLGMSPEEAAEWRRHTKAEFNLWAQSVECDLYRKHNFYDMQDVAFISSIVDGDAWAAIKYRKALGDNPYTTKIQLFEASRVCNPNTYSLIGALNEVEVRNPKNGNRIINGIEINTDGAVVAYWVADRVPYDPTESRNIKWVRVEAFGRKTGAPNILQISHEERPEQYRGVPILAPAIEELKQMHRYSTAELTAAIIKSYFTLFFKTKDAGEGLPNALPEAFGENEKVAFDQYTFELGAGTMNELPPGYEVQTVDANRSLSTFEAFVNALIAQVGAALEIPSEVLLSRFQSSYSAARGALLQFQAVAKKRRIWFARDFCQPVYERWLAEAVAIGRIQAPGYFSDPLLRKAWSRASWYGPTMGMLDPVKEVQAAKLRVDYGFSTGEQESAEITGTEYEENIAQLQAEHKHWQGNGLNYPLHQNVKTEEGGENDGEK